MDLEQLKKEHGEIYELSAEVDDKTVRCIVRKPSRAAFSRFARDMLTDPFRAMNNLFFDCLLEPTAQEMQRLFEAYPGLVTAFGGRLMSIAKLNLEVVEKKL
jgi:hypothetical protein